MLKSTFTLFLFFISPYLFSQNVNVEPPYESFLLFHFGRGQSGTGDIPGYNFGVAYEKELGKKWFYTIGFEGALHDDDRVPFIWEDPDGNSYDSTLHAVNAGFQLNVGGGYYFIKTAHHHLGLNLALFGRYQATSLNDLEEIQYPALTGYPVPIRFIINETPSRTLAFGGILKFHYDYIFKSRYALGLMGAFQGDTNEDTMYYAAIRFGFYFR